MKPPTDKQREALRALADGPVGSWQFGSTTVATLVRNGWADRVKYTDAAGQASTRLLRTTAGREALEPTEPPSAQIVDLFAALKRSMVKP